MSPKEAAAEILAKLDSSTGYPVVVRDEPTLKVLSTVISAKPGVPFTAIQIRPDVFGCREYLVSWQACFVLRQFELPEEMRWDLAVNGSGTKEVMGSNANNEQKQIIDYFVNSLGVQLRSVPVGLRIDDFLYTGYPCLRDEQANAIHRQLSDNLAVLDPKIRKIVHPKIYEASISMNAAFAIFWSRRWDDVKIALPYKSIGFVHLADQLLEVFSEIEESPSNDRTLVQAWGDKLGISGWYKFLNR